ncbi:MAG: outer membrane lipoprotein carrier protein LolA [Bacteroidales bacterium]
MQRNLIVLILSVFMSLMAHTQPAGYTKVSDTAYILQKVNEVASQTKSINTEFVQEKNLSFLFEKIISKGFLLYEQPDKLRLEYVSPFNYLLIMNGGKLLIKNDDKETKIDLESSSMFNEINDLIINSIQGEILNIPDMKTSFYENSESFFVQLWPKQEELKKYIKTIELNIGKEDYTVTDFKVIELSDDYTLIKFVNKKINEEIPDGRFDIR